MRTAKLAILFLLGPGLAIAQSADETPECVASDSAAVPLVIDERITSVLREARQCLEYRDANCAETAIASLNPDEMEPNARGALRLVTGDIAVVNDALAAAGSEYQEALADSSMHVQIRRGAATRLAILYLRQQEYERLLQHVAGLDCDERSAELDFLEASAFFESDDYDNALTKIDSAIGTRSADGGIVPEPWSLVRDATLQALTGDNLFCETETPIGSNIPVEQCYTLEELRQISACERSARSQLSVNQTVECRPR